MSRIDKVLSRFALSGDPRDLDEVMEMEKEDWPGIDPDTVQ
jgi:hypothetical protein